MSFRRWPVLVAVLLLAVGCSFFGAPRSSDWRAKTDDTAAMLSVADEVRAIDPCGLRSEARRVGKECRSR
mgnify:CR=1 FL=1